MQNGVADFNYFLQRKLIDSLTKPFLFITCELFLNITCTPDNFQKTLKTIKNIEINKYFCVYYLDQLAIPPPHRFILTITSTKQWMPIFIHFFFFFLLILIVNDFPLGTGNFQCLVIVYFILTVCCMYWQVKNILLIVVQKHLMF